MKFSTTVSLFAGLVAALPAVELAPGDVVEARQLGGNTRNDLQNGGACPPVIFIFARGTNESGNLGTLGPRVGSALESEYGRGNVWVQGVGGGYRATLVGNILPDGTSRAAIAEMTKLFQLADRSCPSATIVAGGYSQGAALAAATIRDLSSSIRSKTAGVVLFGYTKNLQNRGKIPNYPADDTRVFCNVGDFVCTGSLIVAAPHLAYQSDASGPAPRFLIRKINAA